MLNLFRRSDTRSVFDSALIAELQTAAREAAATIEALQCRNAVLEDKLTKIEQQYETLCCSIPANAHDLVLSARETLQHAEKMSAWLKNLPATPDATHHRLPSDVYATV
jgi:hypothetical protein